MVKIVKGNLLDCTEDIIVHQVNCQGVMGGGVARQLALQYQNKEDVGFTLEDFYNMFCRKYDCDYEKLKGKVLYYLDNKYIANCFSQKPNFDTDYEALKQCFEDIKKTAIDYNYKTIAMPYKIGCGIANGDWDIVYKIIEDVFSDYDCTLYHLEA